MSVREWSVRGGAQSAPGSQHCLAGVSTALLADNGCAGGASWLQGAYWVVTQFGGDHTCTDVANNTGNRKKGKTSIGSTRRVVQGLDLCSNVRTGRLGKLMADAAAAQGFAVPSDAVLGHARKQTKAEALDSELDEAYTNLAELFNGFPRVDPDSQVVLESEPPELAPDEPRRFSRAMVVPGAARRLDKEGLLTNIMSLDMTFSSFQMNLTDALRLGLKWADGGPLVDPSRQAVVAAPKPGCPPKVTVETGKIAVLIGRSAFRTTVLLAAAVVPAESSDTTSWFLDNAMESLPNLFKVQVDAESGAVSFNPQAGVVAGDGQVVIMSDRGAAIESGIEASVPWCTRVYCFQHLKVLCLSLPCGKRCILTPSTAQRGVLHDQTVRRRGPELGGQGGAQPAAHGGYRAGKARR